MTKISPLCTRHPGSAARIRILTFSTLYPNAAQPTHGVFVENRLRHLVDSNEPIEARVLAPVPWFPFTARRFGRYADFARAPLREQRGHLDVLHPRYPALPKIGMAVAPWLLYRAMRPVVRKLIADGFDFDVLDAHYFYPDGVAAAYLAEDFAKPLTITARGSDINAFMRFRRPRRLILAAARQADAVIAVCQALKDQICAAGIPPDHVRVLRNGVDLSAFHPVDPKVARRQLGVAPPVIISVGGLIPRKDHGLIIRALMALPGVSLLIVGDGPERAALERLAVDTGTADRVRFLGRRPHHELSTLYSAADISVLSSSFEGWANVLLESMACGTPVIASAVGGTPEVLTDPVAGRLLAHRAPEAIAEAVTEVLKSIPDRKAVRAYAERFSWDETTRGQMAVFRDIVEKRA